MAEGRRQRVRAKVAKAGIQILAPHEQLEFFIYPFLPRRDTVPIARQLLAVFGSVNNVLGAPYEELIKIKGMPRLAARTLSLLREIVTEECLLCPSFYVHGANQAASACSARASMFTAQIRLPDLFTASTQQTKKSASLP